MQRLARAPGTGAGESERAASSVQPAHRAADQPRRVGPPAHPEIQVAERDQHGAWAKPGGGEGAPTATLAPSRHRRPPEGWRMEAAVSPLLFPDWLPQPLLTGSSLAYVPAAMIGRRLVLFSRSLCPAVLVRNRKFGESAVDASKAAEI